MLVLHYNQCTENMLGVMDTLGSETTSPAQEHPLRARLMAEVQSNMVKL